MQTTPIPLRPSLATRAQRALQQAFEALHRAHRRWQQLRRTQQTAGALRRLDDRVLHDLGLSRSELLSAAAELHGVARRDRRAALFAPPTR